MNRSAYTENRFGLQFDPRTKIVLLILCVISATIASSLLYEVRLFLRLPYSAVQAGKYADRFSAWHFMALSIY